MLLHELGDALGRHAVVPSSLRIHNHRRALAANAQASDLGTVTSVRPGAEPIFLKERLEGLPCRQACFRSAAIGARAQEHVAVIITDPLLGNDRLQLVMKLAHGSLGGCWGAVASGTPSGACSKGSLGPARIEITAAALRITAITPRDSKTSCA